MRLKNKVAVITGGASGIGRATVLKFVREGAKVVIADMNLAPAEGVVAEVEALGFAGAAIAVQTDVSVYADIAAAVARAVEVFGRLDVIFNNAGIAGGKALSDESIEALHAATAKFKEGFIASDGSRVVNEAEAAPLDADEVAQEQVSVKRTTVRK